MMYFINEIKTGKKKNLLLLMVKFFHLYIYLI